MARKSDREYELSASLINADKRINMLLKEIEDLKRSTAMKDELIQKLDRDLAQLEDYLER